MQESRTMKIAKSPDKLLDAMKRHELAVAYLYEVYAEAFPEFRDFWIGMSEEELQHAGWIDVLWAKVKNSIEDFVVERFQIGTIEHSIQYVEQQAETALQPDFAMINALSTALQLERALIESKYFETYEGDSTGTHNTLTSLADSTRTHCEKLHRFWQENGGG